MRILQSLIECGGDKDKLNSAPGFAVLRRHFHLTTDDLKQPGFLDFLQPLNTILQDLKNTYNWMSYVLRSALKEPVFINNPVEDEDPETAFVPVLGKRDGRIRFTPLYLQLGKLHQTLTLVHEASHFVSNVVQDYCYRRANPGKYDTLESSVAMLNADSYAYFAFHCASGSKRILQNSE